LLKEERVHFELVRRERGSYYIRRKQGIYNKSEFLSIILDGADQAAYAMPHFLEQDKLSSSCQKNPCHVMGALVHGRASYAFTYLNNIKHGANIVIECIHRILEDTATSPDGIPPILMIQLDNTTKQNKNQFIVGYLSCLIEWGVVDKILVSFLPVGHTHEDIGILFSNG
jgi:hypothetical protein